MIFTGLLAYVAYAQLSLERPYLRVNSPTIVPDKNYVMIPIENGGSQPADHGIITIQQARVRITGNTADVLSHFRRQFDLSALPPHEASTTITMTLSGWSPEGVKQGSETLVIAGVIDYSIGWSHQAHHEFCFQEVPDDPLVLAVCQRTSPSQFQLLEQGASSIIMEIAPKPEPPRAGTMPRP
jgi:hypothetical protein